MPNSSSARATWPQPAEIRYGRLPGLEARVEEATKALAELQAHQKPQSH